MLLLSLLLLLFILFLELSIVISGEGVERKVVGNKTIKTDYERFVEQQKLFQVLNILYSWPLSCYVNINFNLKV